VSGRLRDWGLRLGSRLTPWLVLGGVVAVVDVWSPVRWDWCVLHLTVLLLALQFIGRQQTPRLLLALVGLSLLPVLFRLPAAPEPVRWWVLIALVSAGGYHFETQRRRQQRLKIRQQLQRRVRRRTLQINRINNALRREIARRQETQQKLDRAETHLESLAQRMKLQVLRKDLDGVITYANEAFCHGVGRTVDEVIGSTDADLYPAPIAAGYREDDDRVLRTGQPVDHIESHPTADGSTGWVQVFKAPEYDEQHRIIGIRMVFWDVTDSYRRTAELRRSEARKRALFEAAREAIMLVDDAGVVVEANPAAETLLSRDGRHLAGQRLDQIALPDSNLSDTVTGDERPADVVGRGDQKLRWIDLPVGQRREIILRPIGETPFPAEVSVHPIPLENSRGLAIFVRDSTLRHRVMAELRESKLAAEDASRIKSEFMANVSHEIRTPLGGITGSAELLAHMDLSPKAQQYVEMIRDSGELLSGIIGDILDLSSIEAGRLKINPTPTDLHRCLGEPFRALATRAIGKDLELILHIHPDVPQIGMVDANRLRQVVINLAGNAIKFTPKGHVWFCVSVDHRPSHPDGQRTAPSDGSRSAGKAEGRSRWLRLEMIDSGIGIAKDQLEKIFVPFEQGDTGTTRRFGGTGLGLSISEQLVRRMGGTIEVISRPGRGSTFRCLIPLPPMEPASRSSAKPHQPNRSSGPRPIPTAVALDIPHPLQRQAIQDLLRVYGYTIDPNAFIRIVDQSLARQPAYGQSADGQPADGRPAAGGRRKTIWLARVDEAAAPDQDPSDPVLIKPILAEDLLGCLRVDSAAARPASGADRQSPTRNASPPAIVSESANQRAAVGRLLLVDDSPVNRAVIRDFLALAGYEVDVAINGQLAISAARANIFACILMDLQMPGMDGIEAMGRMIASYRDRGLEPPPFIALTAHATAEHRERCLREGMRDFLVKPIDREILIRTVDALVLPPVDALVLPPADALVLPPADGADAAVPGSIPDESTPLADASTDDEPRGDWRAKLLQTAGGDLQTVEALVEAFLIEVPALCETLALAVRDHDAIAARRAAHTLKSCLRYVAPAAEWTRAQAIEEAAEREDWPTIDHHHLGLQAIAQSWVTRLRQPESIPRP